MFFLISGFVIPFSLRSQDPGPFLLARVFRIFPTFWAALLIEWLTVHAISIFTGRPAAFDVVTYFYNAFLLDTAIGSGFVDLVNWTLAVEVKFYLVMAILQPSVRKGRVSPLFGISLLAVLLASAQKHGLLPVASTLAVEPMYIGFMLIGTIFHYHLTGLVDSLTAALAILGLGALFVLCWSLGPISSQLPTLTLNYLYGFVIFCAAYMLRHLFRPSFCLDALADISYPFYLIHSVIGYSVMGIAMHVFGLSYFAALTIAVFSTLSLATFLHLMVERPTIAIGRRLARRVQHGRPGSFAR